MYDESRSGSEVNAIRELATRQILVRFLASRSTNPLLGNARIELLTIDPSTQLILRAWYTGDHPFFAAASGPHRRGTAASREDEGIRSTGSRGSSRFLDGTVADWWKKANEWVYAYPYVGLIDTPFRRTVEPYSLISVLYLTRLHARLRQRCPTDYDVLVERFDAFMVKTMEGVSKTFVL